MFTNQTRQRVFMALSLMVLLFFGAVVEVQAEHRRDTNGSDRLVKGAAAGAAVGAITQVVRGRTEGRELLKGAAVGAAAGAAVGAYSDYKQEKDARRDAERDAGYYDDYRPHRNRGYRNGRGGGTGRGYAQNPRSYRGGHRHNARCGHH